MHRMFAAKWVGFAILALAACSGGGGPKGDGGTGGSSCTLPAHISTNTTLDGSCSPWRIGAGGTVVSGSASPVLTIQPGVTVDVDPGGYLSIGVDAPGGLTAVGTAASPIHFTSASAGPWAGVALGAQALASSSLAFADIQFAGAADAQGHTTNADGYTYAEPAGAIVAYTTSAMQISLHDLTLEHVEANGIVLDGFNLGYASGSGRLTVSDWGTGFAPFLIAANEASTLPATLQATGGVVDLIGGDGRPPGTGGAAIVTVSQTWPAIPLPYLVDGATQGAGGGLQIEGAGNSTATLTIAAPNTLSFKSGGTLTVDPNGSAQAALVANATAGNPIEFGSALASPAAGSWGGLLFNAPSAGGNALLTSTLQGVLIDSAGDGSLVPGGQVVAVQISAGSASSGPKISGCTFTNYPASACAIGYDGTFTTPPASYDKPANTFQGTSCTVDSSA